MKINNFQGDLTDVSAMILVTHTTRTWPRGSTRGRIGTRPPHRRSSRRKAERRQRAGTRVKPRCVPLASERRSAPAPSTPYYACPGPRNHRTQPATSGPTANEQGASPIYASEHVSKVFFNQNSSVVILDTLIL